MAKAGFSHILLALKHRDFRIFIIGHLFSHTGMWMFRIATGWVTWELTHSATWLGLIGAADMSSTLLIGPLMGALADRVDRLTIIRITQAITTMFAFLTFLLVYNGWATPELLFVLVLCFGISMSANLPARLAIVPNLIGPENLPAGIAINSLVSNAGRFLGPALGGFAIHFWGAGEAIAGCALFMGLPVFTLWLIRAPRNEIIKSGKRLMGDAADGIKYSMRHAGIGPVMFAMISTSVFGKTLVYLFPAFASEVFDRGADGLAWLTGTVGAGAVLGGVYMARRVGRTGLSRMFVMSIAVVGVTMLVFAGNTQFWPAVFISACLGGAILVNGVAAQTLIQHAVDGAMRGRVNSLYAMIQRGGQSLGSLILGVSADLLGLRWSVAAAGIVCLLFWVWSVRRLKTMSTLLEN